MKIRLTLFISFLFSIGFAQEHYKFRHFTTDDGLPTNSIYAITEDQKGNIVLGTDNGLTFFDGTDFKTLNVKDGLINPYIVGLTNDEKGNIWFINYGGKLQKIVNNKIITTTVFTDYYNQITNTNNKIYLFTSQRWNKNKQYTGIGIFKNNNYKIDADTLNRNSKIAPQTLSQNNETIELHNNILRYQKNAITLPKEVKLIHKVIFRNRLVYILEDTKLYVLKHKSDLIHTIELPQSLSANRFYKYDFIIDHKENCWLSIQGKGLFLLKNNKWISVHESLGLSSNDNINFLYCDKKGRLWIATNEKGLFCIPTVFIQNISFKNVENNFNGFATSANQKSLFIATNFKLYSYKNDQIHFLEESLLPIKIDNVGATPIYYFPYQKNAPEEKKLKSLTKKAGRQLIKKTGSEYYSLFSLSSLVAANDSDNREHFIENKVPKKEKIRNIVFHKKEYYFNNYHKINIRTFDDKNIYEKRELKFKIKGFIEDFTFINDTMWVAASDVVYKIFNEKIIDSITSVNTIKLEDVRRIKPIGEDVYLCSRIGLFKIGKMGNRVLNKYNFLPSNDVFNVIVFGKELFVGTIEGLGKIKKAIVDAKSDNPKLEIYYKGTPTNTINVKTEVSEIALQLKIQNYYDIRNQFIQYKINDLSWIAAISKNITIPVSNFGNYRVHFRVKDVNSDWTTQNITINRAYPFYMKWPFITVLILLISGIIYLLYRNQIQKIRKEKRKEIAINNTIVELRQNALSAMMNPHFLFNSLNAIQYFINSNQKEKSSEYLGKLARLVRLFLSHSSEPFITLNNEIKRLKLYLELEQVRFNNFTYQIHIDAKIDLIKTKIPNMIVQPFIENAILHGIAQLKQNDGTIDLNFILKNELLIIEILDNGFGLEDKKQKSSHISKGIHITSERLEILQNSYPDKTFALKQESVYPNTIRKGHKVTIQVTILTE